MDTGKTKDAVGGRRRGWAVVVWLVVLGGLVGGYWWEVRMTGNAAGSMNFVNARISEADVEKYQLRELWNRYDPDVYEGLDPFASGRKQWVIDKQADAFLILVDSGGIEDPGLLKFVMRWQSQDYVVMMRIGAGGSKEFSKVPFVRYWELESISGPGNKNDALEVLRAAITTYGVVGLIHQFEELELHFNF